MATNLVGQGARISRKVLRTTLRDGMGFIQAFRSFCLAALVAGCTHLPSSDEINGAWILDPQATEREIDANPPKSFGVGWSYVGLLCPLGWVVRQESLHLVDLGPRGKRFEYLVIDPKVGRYGQTQINPRTVIVRRKGQHLSIESEDGGLVSDQLRWKRIDEDTLTSAETRRRSEEECLAAFDRVYQRYRSK
jgi:hypothetical protein